MTLHLYDDGHIRQFSAQVLDCRETEDGFDITLDRTAFFPGGGGQLPDTGYIGASRVFSVREQDGEIIHTAQSPADKGGRVDCSIDWPVRFARMQSHSGEHIFSGAVHGLFGYDNVGFHMEEAEMTIDFNGSLDDEQIHLAERAANRVVWENRKINIRYPSSEELGALEYRSKLDLKENVRIVEIDGADRCACCAPHVAYTGEIGLIKVLGSMRHRGGTRLRLCCGSAALEDCFSKYENTARISALLSAKQEETALAVERMLDERQKLKDEIYHLKKERNEALIDSLRPTQGNICIFQHEIDTQSMREIVNAGAVICGGMCAVFSGDDMNWRYIIGSEHIDLRAMAGKINEAISGRGGGSEKMIQGSASASRKVIEQYFDGGEIK